MKEATIKKANDLINLIDHAHQAEEILTKVQRVDFVIPPNGNYVANIYPLEEKGNVTFYREHLPDELSYQIRSEMLRFLARAKRHLANYEYKLKQELEDLSDEN